VDERLQVIQRLTKLFAHPGQFGVLNRLLRGPATAEELSGELNVSLSTLYRHAAALAEGGLVDRRGGPEGFLYLLTERGRGLVNRFFAACSWFFDLKAGGEETELLGVGVYDLRRLVGECWRWNEWRLLRGFVVEEEFLKTESWLQSLNEKLGLGLELKGAGS